MRAKSLQLCPTLCDFMDYGLPSSSVYGILQARILDRVVMPSSWGSSQPGSCLLYWQIDSLPLAPPEKALFRSIRSYCSKLVSSTKLCLPEDRNHKTIPVPEHIEKLAGFLSAMCLAIQQYSYFLLYLDPLQVVRSVTGFLSYKI